MLEIIQVVPAIAEEASGPSYSVVRLCESLIAEQERVTLVALDWSPLAHPPTFLKAFPLGWGPRRLGRSPAMNQWLLQGAKANDFRLIHNHGMWQMNAVYPGNIARATNTILITSPRGSFSSWAMSHGSPIKKIFWPLWQRPAMAATTCFHATAEIEYEEIRQLGFKQPVAIIPNGIDVPAYRPKRIKELRTLLYLGRLHPKKGLAELLAAWREISPRYPDWQLKLVGSDVGYHGATGYEAALKKNADDLKLERVHFVGELRGKDKLNAYQEAELFILPTHSENFGMTVAESLAAGTPVIVTKGAPWESVEHNQCGWWIDIGTAALINCLETALQKEPASLVAMGQQGRKWMNDAFSWHRVGQMMSETYRWIEQGGAAPPWIKLN